MTAYIDLPSELDLAAKATHIAVQRDEAIRIAHRLHQTCESLIYGMPKYLEQTAQTDEENMIGKAWHTFDAAAWQLASLPQPTATEPCFECGSVERIGTACAPCNPDLAAAPASPLPEGGGWRNLNDAPRDGSEFQAWWKGTWQPRARFDPEYGSFQLWGRTDFDTEGWEVFEMSGFWQPQPAAPTGAK